MGSRTIRFGTGRQHERIAAIFCDNLRGYLAGQPLRNLVDPKLGY